jgi:hypothetical protein
LAYSGLDFSITSLESNLKPRATCRSVTSR